MERDKINIFEKITNIGVKKIFKKEPRVGDHIWYISNNDKFKRDYPNWKQEYNIEKILYEIIDNFKSTQQKKR